MQSCSYCGKTRSDGLLRCSTCQVAYYCSKAHQQADWKKHKGSCTRHSKGNREEVQAWENSAPKDQYIGTFPWGTKKDFLKLPDFPTLPPSLEGWQSYLESRLGVPGSQEDIRVDIPLIDGLSFPLSVVWALHKLVSMHESMKQALLSSRKHGVVIVALGCSQRAEQHILESTNYWQELALFLPRRPVQLWLVGPEISAEAHMKPRPLTGDLIATCFRGTASAFWASDKGTAIMALIEQSKTVTADGSGSTGSRPLVLCVAYNSGMASGDEKLKRSWAEDMPKLLHSQLPIIFTCANDHTDLQGERQLMEKVWRAKYLLYPRRNPFDARTVMHPPGEKESAWYSANAFIYVVQGFADDAPTKLQGAECRDLPAEAKPSDLKCDREPANRIPSSIKKLQDGTLPSLATCTTANVADCNTRTPSSHAQHLPNYIVASNVKQDNDSIIGLASELDPCFIPLEALESNGSLRSCCVVEPSPNTARLVSCPQEDVGKDIETLEPSASSLHTVSGEVNVSTLWLPD